jgi:hypothetical protein
MEPHTAVDGMVRGRSTLRRICQRSDKQSIVPAALPSSPDSSQYRVEKLRIHARVTLSTHEVVEGCFFVAGASALGSVPERVGEILNAEAGFFPFEVSGAPASRTTLYNRDQVVSVSLAEAEARRDSGYDVAKPQQVSVRMADGGHLTGTVRVFRPQGRDRLSDWARDSDRFRYLEIGDTTVIINMNHVIELSEDPAS